MAQFDQAMIASILSSVFGNSTGGGGTPTQAVQGNQGHLGGSQGVGQGAIGAAVPQLGPAGGTQAHLGPQAAPSAPATNAGAGGAGMAQFAPLLQILGPLLMHLLGPMLGGGAPAGGAGPKQ